MIIKNLKCIFLAVMFALCCLFVVYNYIFNDERIRRYEFGDLLEKQGAKSMIEIGVKQGIVMIIVEFIKI